MTTTAAIAMNHTDEALTLTFEAAAKQKYDPYKVGKIYLFDKLMPQHQKEVLLWYSKDELERWGIRFVRQEISVAEMIKHHRGPWVTFERAKKKDQERILKIEEAIENGGVMRPLLVDEDYDVLEGQHRIQAMIHMKWKHVPIIRILGTASKIGF